MNEHKDLRKIENLFQEIIDTTDRLLSKLRKIDMNREPTLRATVKHLITIPIIMGASFLLPVIGLLLCILLFVLVMFEFLFLVQKSIASIFRKIKGGIA